jgi:hypothetical protein
MNFIQALVWNLGTHGLMLRENIKWQTHKIQSTDAAMGADWAVVVRKLL